MGKDSVPPACRIAGTTRSPFVLYGYPPFEGRSLGVCETPTRDLSHSYPILYHRQFGGDEILFHEVVQLLAGLHSEFVPWVSIALGGELGYAVEHETDERLLVSPVPSQHIVGEPLAVHAVVVHEVLHLGCVELGTLAVLIGTGCHEVVPLSYQVGETSGEFLA